MPVLERYLAEFTQPPGGWRELQALTARARAAADRLSEEGNEVRFLRAIYLPQDESCLFLYEGASAEAVRKAARSAELAIERIGETVRLDDQPEENKP